MDDERSAPSEPVERPETVRRAIASLREIVPARHAASDFAADQLAETARDAGELVAVLRVSAHLAATATTLSPLFGDGLRRRIRRVIVRSHRVE